MAKSEGRPKSTRVTKDEQIMVRTTEDTATELRRIAVELDRSVSWLLNDLAVKFVAAHPPKKKTKEDTAQGF
jgi:hypothetical protein